MQWPPIIHVVRNDKVSTLSYMLATLVATNIYAGGGGASI